MGGSRDDESQPNLPGALSPAQRKVRDAAKLLHEALEAKKASAKEHREKCDELADTLAEVLDEFGQEAGVFGPYEVMSELKRKFKIKKRKGAKDAGGKGRREAS